MGNFPKTKIVNYHLSFADQGKHSSIFRFCLQQTKESLFFAVSDFCLQLNESRCFP
jgi:hypothetical protein